VEGRLAIFGAKEDAEAVLAVVAGARVPAADAQADVGLEALVAVGVDQLEGRGALPGDAVAARAGVDAAAAAQVGQVGRDRAGRDREQVVLDRRGVGADVGHGRVHAVVDLLARRAGRGPARAGGGAEV